MSAKSARVVWARRQHTLSQSIIIVMRATYNNRRIARFWCVVIARARAHIAHKRTYTYILYIVRIYIFNAHRTFIA